MQLSNPPGQLRNGHPRPGLASAAAAITQRGDDGDGLQRRDLASLPGDRIQISHAPGAGNLRFYNCQQDASDNRAPSIPGLPAPASPPGKHPPALFCPALALSLADICTAPASAAAATIVSVPGRSASQQSPASTEYRLASASGAPSRHISTRATHGNLSSLRLPPCQCPT